MYILKRKGLFWNTYIYGSVLISGIIIVVTAFLGMIRNLKESLFGMIHIIINFPVSRHPPPNSEKNS